jgi:hypothetical protein
MYDYPAALAESMHEYPTGAIPVGHCDVCGRLTEQYGDDDLQAWYCSPRCRETLQHETYLYACELGHAG